MDRILVVDHDRGVAQQLGLQCLERGAGVVIAETLCDGVRALLSERVSVIAVDLRLMRMTPLEYAALFDRVAPGVPVVVVVPPEASLDSRVALELAGFRVLVRPVTAEEILDKA